jgi:hypothetical protein
MIATHSPLINKKGFDPINLKTNKASFALQG